MRVEAEALPRGETDHFRRKEGLRQMYNVAAMLWNTGMSWAEALDIAKKAFEEVPAA